MFYLRFLDHLHTTISLKLEFALWIFKYKASSAPSHPCRGCYNHSLNARDWACAVHYYYSITWLCFPLCKTNVLITWKKEKKMQRVESLQVKNSLKYWKEILQKDKFHVSHYKCVLTLYTCKKCNINDKVRLKETAEEQNCLYLCAV